MTRFNCKQVKLNMWTQSNLICRAQHSLVQNVALFQSVLFKLRVFSMFAHLLLHLGVTHRHMFLRGGPVANTPDCALPQGLPNLFSIHPSISLAICYPRGRGGRAAVGLYKIRLRENSSGFHSPLVVLSAVFSSRCHFPRRVMSTAVSSLRSFESHSSPSKIIQLSRFSPFSWKHATLLIAINLYSPQVTWREQLRRHSVVKVTSDNRARQSWSRIG